MRSSSGQHFVALDHVRAVAAFMVFSWHFLHSHDGTPIPFEGAPSVLPFALLDEGHTGVSLFMVLSGYLFAKLLDGRQVSYGAFLWNRMLRLAPLLVFVFGLVALERWLKHADALGFLRSLPEGLVFPTWPNGGWSITTEIHFYLLLPVLLLLARRSRALPLAVIAAAMVVRTVLYAHFGEVQSLAYWTIVGRIDQFTFGVLAFQFARDIGAHRRLALGALLGFVVFWWWFDDTGGFYQRPGYPSPSALWIWLPSIEGLAYGLAIACYDGLGITARTPASKLLQKLGEYSYSIYLLHFFVVFKAVRLVDSTLMSISNIYVGVAWALVTFVLMLVPGYLSFRFIESPFLRLRKPYARVSVDRTRVAPAAAPAEARPTAQSTE